MKNFKTHTMAIETRYIAHVATPVPITEHEKGSFANCCSADAGAVASAKFIFGEKEEITKGLLCNDDAGEDVCSGELEIPEIGKNTKASAANAAIANTFLYENFLIFQSYPCAGGGTSAGVLVTVTKHDALGSPTLSLNVTVYNDPGALGML